MPKCEANSKKFFFYVGVGSKFQTFSKTFESGRLQMLQENMEHTNRTLALINHVSCDMSGWALQEAGCYTGRHEGVGGEKRERSWRVEAK